MYQDSEIVWCHPTEWVIGNHLGEKIALNIPDLLSSYGTPEMPTDLHYSYVLVLVCIGCRGKPVSFFYAPFFLFLYRCWMDCWLSVGQWRMWSKVMSEEIKPMREAS